MKTKTTSKQMRAWENRIMINTKYVYLLYGIDPSFYNSGVYGWNYDAYVINNSTVLIEGYRNMPITARATDEQGKKYDGIAHKIIDQEWEKRIALNNQGLTDGEKENARLYLQYERERKLSENLEQFISEVLEQEEGK